MCVFVCVCVCVGIGMHVFCAHTYLPAYTYLSVESGFRFRVFATSLQGARVEMPKLQFQKSVRSSAPF